MSVCVFVCLFVRHTPETTLHTPNYTLHTPHHLHLTLARQLLKIRLPKCASLNWGRPPVAQLAGHGAVDEHPARIS